MSATHPTPAVVKDSLTPAPSLLDAIRAEQIAQHARRMAMLEDPATVARVALAESLEAELSASGFDPFHQFIFNTDSWHGEGDVSITLHAHIRADHWLSGEAALADVLNRRGGIRGPKNAYTENGHTIDLAPHARDFGRGWAPLPADQAA